MRPYQLKLFKALHQISFALIRSEMYKHFATSL